MLSADKWQSCQEVHHPSPAPKKLISDPNEGCTVLILPSPKLSTEGHKLTWPGEDALWGPSPSCALLYLESLSGQIKHKACNGQSLCQVPASVCLCCLGCSLSSEKPCSSGIVTNRTAAWRRGGLLNRSGEAPDWDGANQVHVLFVLTAIYSVFSWELNERVNKRVHRTTSTVCHLHLGLAHLVAGLISTHHSTFPLSTQGTSLI